MEAIAVVDGNVTHEEGRHMVRTVIVLAALLTALVFVVCGAAGVVLWRLVVRILR